MKYATPRSLLMLILGYGLAHASSEAGSAVGMPQEPLREDSFVRVADVGMCDKSWSRWPAIQETAIENGTVMIWKMGTSIGNIMKTFMFVLPVSFSMPAVGLLTCYQTHQKSLRMTRCAARFSRAHLQSPEHPTPVLCYHTGSLRKYIRMSPAPRSRKKYRRPNGVHSV